MLRRQFPRRLEPLTKGLWPTDPDSVERKRLREVRPLGVDEAQRSACLNLEFMGQRLPKR